MTVHEQVLEGMRAMAEKFFQAGVPLHMPPPSNSTLGTRYTDIDFGKTLTAEIQFDPRFCNPMMAFQGGFLCAAFDDVFGPLTYMAAGRPVATVEMSTTFLRPFTERDGVMTIRAEVAAKTRSLLYLKAEARNPEGKLMASSTSHSLILDDQNLKPKGANQG